jgi:DNA recombination protein RmuC
VETALFTALGLAAGLAIAGLAAFIARPWTPAADPTAERMIQLLRLQHEAAADIKSTRDTILARQTEVEQNVNKRLDAVTQNVQNTLSVTKKDTDQNLEKLNQRLVIIDHAQKNITDLASQVTSLQNVLASKQQRGAFGQGRMEIIVQDGLPKDCYEFQATLSNKSRPDCCILMPDQRRLIVDAKFPLEAVTAFRDAKIEEQRAVAARQLRQDIGKHISDIANKYLIPGETQELALMFVPSESIYAELYDGFDDVFQKAFRSNVVIVSPSLLMLAIHVIQQIQKDARMREAADQIRAEVGHLMDDLGRLGDRVRKLQTHFNQANEDIRQAIISMEKVERRGERIREVEFDDEEQPTGNIISAPVRKLQAAEF